jgi:DNA mismatch repair ATPase MutS
MSYKPKYLIHQKENPKFLNLQLIGKFYEAFGNDAYVLGNIMGYKVKVNNKGTAKSGFPVEALDKVINVLESKKVSYAVYHADEITHRKKFLLNQYKKYMKGEPNGS